MNNNLFYQIALTLIPDVGNVLAKTLVSYCGGVEEVFKSSRKKLQKAPGIGEKIAAGILSKTFLERAEEECRFVEDNNINTWFYLDKGYPFRLKECHDGPVLLYQKGTTDLNNRRTLSVVGTRNATEYGKTIITKIINDLATYDVLIVSGMAFGVDITAHRAAVNAGLPTIGILASGVDKVSPTPHHNTSVQMIEHGGGLISEFPSNSQVFIENFPRRNRIIAGISDATLVVQTDVKGGSMITAFQANSYNRELLAVPGRVGDKSAAGCNKLIKTNIASLVENGDDVCRILGWDIQTNNLPRQRQLFVELDEKEQLVADLFKETNSLQIDLLNSLVPLSYSEVAACLLTMEMKGVIKSLPGSVLEYLG